MPTQRTEERLDNKLHQNAVFNYFLTELLGLLARGQSLLLSPVVCYEYE